MDKPKIPLQICLLTYLCPPPECKKISRIINPARFICFRGPSDRGWFIRRHTSFTIKSHMARRKLCRSSELLATWTCYSIPVIPLLPPTHPELSFQVIYLSLYVWIFHSSNSCSVLQLRNNAESRFTGDRIIHHELKEVWLYLFFFSFWKHDCSNKSSDLNINDKTFEKNIFQDKVLPSGSIYVVTYSCDLQGKTKIIRPWGLCYSRRRWWSRRWRSCEKAWRNGDHISRRLMSMPYRPPPVFPLFLCFMQAALRHTVFLLLVLVEVFLV